MLRIGIIGTGNIAHAHMKGILASNNSALIAVCDIQESKINAFLSLYDNPDVAIFHDHVSLFEANIVDAVIVCTPTSSHKDIVLKALSFGIHVLCEKVMAMNEREAFQMLEKAREKKLVTSIGFAFRYIPAIDYIKDLVESDLFGKIHHFRGRFYANRLAPKDHEMEWRHRIDEAGSGVIGDLASHTFDMFSYLVKDHMGSVVDVKAHGSIIIPTRKNKNNKLEQVTAEETLLVWMKTEKDAEITLESSRYSPFEFDFHITGSKASVKYSNYRYNQVELITYDKEGVYSQNDAQIYEFVDVPEKYFESGHKDRFIRQFLDFEKAIREDNFVKADFETGYENQIMMDKIQESLNKN